MAESFQFGIYNRWLSVFGNNNDLLIKSINSEGITEIYYIHNGELFWNEPWEIDLSDGYIQNINFVDDGFYIILNSRYGIVYTKKYDFNHELQENQSFSFNTNQTYLYPNLFSFYNNTNFIFANTHAVDSHVLVLDLQSYLLDGNINVPEISEEIEKAIAGYEATIVVMGFEKWNVLKYRLFEKLKIPIWVAAGGGDVVVGACSNLAPNMKVPKFIKDFSKATNYKAILLYIIDTEDKILVNENGERIKADIDELRERAKKFAEKYKKVEIREGVFEEELVKFADEVNAGLIVIGREMKKRRMLKEVRKDIVKNLHHSVLFLN